MLEANKETLSNITRLHDYGLLFSNVVVVEKEMTLKKEFTDAVITDFGASVVNEDFIHDAHIATKHINEFVNLTTKGKIGKLFDEDLSSDTRAVLVNTLYLNASFLTKFDTHASFVSPFNLANGKTKNVTYMTIPAHKLKKSRVHRGFGFDTVQIPFDEDERLYFGIMLPSGNDGNMDCCARYVSHIRGSYERPVKLTLPKFAITQAHDALKSILQGMGIQQMFDRNTADLSGIDGAKDLFVSKVAQKATVTVNEAGVEAAAATGVVIETKSLHLDPPNALPFYVDHPFIFSISDRASDLDLFVGIVYEP